MTKMPPTTTAQTDPVPLDLHALYRATAGAGYVRELRLSSVDVQRITARLRGIGAISALLIAAQNDDALNLSAWFNAGMLDALETLARDTADDIEHANDRALRAQQAGGAA